MSTAEPPPSVVASFYRRPLPDGLIAFASPEGRRLFRESLETGGMEGWFALAEQFHTQAEPAFCGLGSLVVALNALEIDPGRIWKGPWRWFGEELLDCCVPLAEVQERGVTLDELACLARCNGAQARTFRAEAVGVAALRAEVRAATATARGPVVIAGYSRHLLGQTGSGHFSPIGGFHAGRDLALVLDVARFKYPPHWVPVELLWQAMTDVDPATGRSRGFIVLDRGPGQRLPLHFRLSAGDGLGALVSTLLEEAPALLASAPADSPEALVAGWVNAVEARIAGALCRGLGVGGDHASARLPPEHQAAVAAVLAELRATRAHRAVVGARATEGARRVPDDVLATLLLALPEGVLTALPPPAREAVATLRTPGEVGTALAAELAALGEQLTTLRQWQCSVPRR